MMRGCLVLLFILLPLAAEPRTLKLSTGFVEQKAIETFADPVYVGENDYIAANTQQLRLSAAFNNFFRSPFELSYQALNVGSGEEIRFGKSYRLRGYFTSFIQASSYKDTGFLRWHYGLAVLATFSSRSHFDTGNLLKDTAVDTRLSQAYPSGGFTLFPLAPVRFRMTFLDGDANLLYGWLRMQVEYENSAHTLSAAVEILNHLSFGKGLPNFAQPPTALQLGYSYRADAVQLGGRLGFVLNPTQGFANARLGLIDRLVFEFSVTWLIELH